MHYIESGSGDPLLLFHAFPLDARMWNPTRSRLEHHFRVIAVDQRGLGASPLNDASDTAPPPDLDVVARDALELLDDLGLERMIVGGCSMGGYVALALLRMAPERVAGLLLVDTKAEADDATGREARLVAADRAETEGTAGWLADNMIGKALGETSLRERTDLVAEVRAAIESQPAAGVAWAQRMMAQRPDSAATLSGYIGPALVVFGEEDVLTPPSTGHVLAGLLPNAEAVTLAAAGHLAPLEVPDAFADAVLHRF